MNLEWINSIYEDLNNTNIFSVTIIGAKSIAIAIILYRVISHFVTTTENTETPKIGGYLNIIGYGLLIVSSEWIINGIESAFASFSMTTPAPNAYTQNHIKEYLMSLEQETTDMDVMSKIYFYISLLPVYISAGIMTITQFALYLLDTAIVALYLIQRLFLIQLYKVVFPFAVAFSAFNNNAEMLIKWSKIYMGLFFLGVAYTGIIGFGDLIFHKWNTSFSIDSMFITSLGELFIYSCGGVLVSFLIKLSLFSIVTKEVRSFFN